MSHVMDCSCNDHGQQFHVCELAAEVVVDQQAAQGLGDVCSMYAVVIRVLRVVGSLNILQ